MKTRIQLLAFTLLFSCFAMSAQATETTTRAQSEARVMQIKQRVDEIRSANLAGLSRLQRKEIKHELKDMNKELRQMDPVIVYISAGGLILIIILLILLL